MYLLSPIHRAFSRCANRRNVAILMAGFALATVSKSLLMAQSVCLPLPRLLTMMPMGGTAGAQVEITISGENIEDVSQMLFNHPGLGAVPKLDANGLPVDKQFIVSIAENCPDGIYEARVLTRLGISSSRVFSVSHLPESVRATPNTTLDTAMELSVNSICNAVITEKSVDHYTFKAEQGHRYIVHCSSRGIDSKLDPVVIVADSQGRDLVVQRQGDVLDFVATESGKHVIKIHELTFKGGLAYFYRLSLTEIPIGDNLPSFASTKPVNAFSWPPDGLPEEAATVEASPEVAASEPQTITLPCDLSGSFFPAADVDTFEFVGKAGDAWWVEVASERLGRPTDPSVLIQKVTGEGDTIVFTDVAEFTDIASPIKPSSNGYAYDGPPYDGGSLDIINRLEIKEDGRYRLRLIDLFGSTRNDRRNRYRLIIRQAAPDFALAAWGLHMELRNGDRNALSKPLSLRGGSTLALEVVAVRRDGFDGDIELVMEGLPQGVSSAGLKIPSGKTNGILLITAEADAPKALTQAKFYGVSEINGQTVQRSVRMAQMAWPIVDAWNEIPSPRLVDGIPVSVTDSELAPLTIAAKESKVYDVKVGEKVSIPLAHVKRSEFSGSVLQLKTLGHGFESVPRFDVSLGEDSSEATLDLAALKTPPGEYMIAFYGSAVAKYRYNPSDVFVAEAAVRNAEAELNALTLEVQKLTEVTNAAPEATKDASNQLLATAIAKKQASEAALLTSSEKLKAANQKATPSDTVEIIISKPITIRVNPAGTQ